jgi:hypothetical protein
VSLVLEVVDEVSDRYASLREHGFAPEHLGIRLDDRNSASWRTSSWQASAEGYGHAERVQAEVWLGGTEYGHL